MSARKHHRELVGPLKRANLRTRLAELIFEEIVKGTFKPGDRIVEGPFARELGVSQSSLREALHELEHQGVVTKFDNRGTFVTKLSREQIDQLYAVRQQLEPFAARLAHTRMTQAVRATLTDLLRKMRFAIRQRDLVELARLDLDFHRTIWRLSGNEWLERALRLVGTPLLAFDYVGLYESPTYNFDKMHCQHESLLHALGSGTPDDARKSFEHTIEDFRLLDIANLESLRAAPVKRRVKTGDADDRRTRRKQVKREQAEAGRSRRP